DEDNVLTARPRRQQGTWTRLANISLTRGQELQHRGRAIDRLNRDVQTFILEVAFTDRHMQGEVVKSRRIGHHKGEILLLRKGLPGKPDRDGKSSRSRPTLHSNHRNPPDF